RSQATARPSFQIRIKSTPVTRAQTIVCEITRLSPQTGIHCPSPDTAAVSNRSPAKIGLSNVLVLNHIGARPGQNDAAALQQIGVVAHLERRERVLLHQQYRRAGIADAADDRKGPLDDVGREP